MIKGTHPTLLNVTYIRPGFTTDDSGNKVKIEEAFEVIYKDDNGFIQKSYEPPNADIYIVKPQYRTYKYNKPEERMEHMEKVTVPVSKIRFRIAEELGEQGVALVKECMAQRNFKKLDQLYTWPYAYACDFQPEYYFMKNWYEKYPLKGVKLTKAFLDIEVDQIDYAIDMDDIPNTAKAPVNLVTVIFEETKESWTFMLKSFKPTRLGRSEEEYKERRDMYLKQKEAQDWLEDHKKEFIDDLHNRFDSTYGYLDYHFRLYDDEIDLIVDLFNLINDRKPNFCLSWNMRFDIQYLYYRIIALGYDPKYIMCHPDFPQKKCYFRVDRSTYMIEKQYDYFYCSSYTMYICLMRLFASIRKSQHKLKSVSLNAIGDLILRDRKVEYPAEANIITFAYLNWILFSVYNIKDVLIMLGIERKTNDVMTYYMRSHSNLTPYNKIFKETHLLRNVREMYFNKDGWVQGNNLNIIDDPDAEDKKAFYELQDDEDNSSTFKGAIMADPIWNAPIGMKVLGKKTNNIFQNSMDYDMGAFYPSIKIASNMDPITLLYNASFVNEEFISGEMPNRSLNTTYFEKDKKGRQRPVNFTGEAVNTYVSGNILSFGYMYLGLPSITEFATEILRKVRKAAKAG